MKAEDKWLNLREELYYKNREIKEKAEVLKAVKDGDLKTAQEVLEAQSTLLADRLAGIEAVTLPASKLDERRVKGAFDEFSDQANAHHQKVIAMRYTLDSNALDADISMNEFALAELDKQAEALLGIYYENRKCHRTKPRTKRTVR